MVELYVRLTNINFILTNCTRPPENFEIEVQWDFNSFLIIKDFVVVEKSVARLECKAVRDVVFHSTRENLDNNFIKITLKKKNNRVLQSPKVLCSWRISMKDVAILSENVCVLKGILHTDCLAIFSCRLRVDEYCAQTKLQLCITNTKKHIFSPCVLIPNVSGATRGTNRFPLSTAWNSKSGTSCSFSFRGLLSDLANAVLLLETESFCVEIPLLHGAMYIYRHTSACVHHFLIPLVGGMWHASLTWYDPPSTLRIYHLKTQLNYKCKSLYP